MSRVSAPQSTPSSLPQAQASWGTNILGPQHPGKVSSGSLTPKTPESETWGVHRGDFLQHPHIVAKQTKVGGGPGTQPQLEPSLRVPGAVGGLGVGGSSRHCQTGQSLALPVATLATQARRLL